MSLLQTGRTVYYKDYYLEWLLIYFYGVTYDF